MAMLKPREMADCLGVTVRTLQEWDRKGIFPAHRTPTNKRYYTEQVIIMSETKGNKMSKEYRLALKRRAEFLKKIHFDSKTAKALF